MEDLIKLVAEKTGISTAQATMAVETVAGFIKTKLPGDAGDLLGGLKDKMGGLF